jgi:hypothetical protein
MYRVGGNATALFFALYNRETIVYSVNKKAANMKQLILLFVTLICLQGNAQQRYAYDDRPSHHMLLLEGGYTPGVVHTTVPPLYRGASETVSTSLVDYEFALGYRYSLASSVRVGLNMTYGRLSEAVVLSVHADFPVRITHDLFISPGINMSYGSIVGERGKEQLMPGASVGVMYLISDNIAVNIEPGLRLYVQKSSGYEVPLRIGLRFLF